MPDTFTPEQKPADAERSIDFVPDATNLAWLAETADGFRGEDLFLIIDQNQNLQLVRQNALGNANPIAKIVTPKIRPNRKQVTEVICKYEGGEETLSFEDGFDAVFWTESSVEKFLYPYYRSHRLWDDRMERLKKQFDSDDSAVAVAHRAPSMSSLISSDDTITVGLVKGKKLMWVALDRYLAGKFQPSE